MFDVILGNLKIGASPNSPPLSLSLLPSNVTLLEVGVTVLLAVMVCAVAGLLLATGFYRDFWAFWFCFVVATAHFSLVKVTPSFHSAHTVSLFHSTECTR